MEISGTVILDMQRRVYERKSSLEQARAQLVLAHKEVALAENRIQLEELQLYDVVAFLAEHNADCCDWFGEFGLKRKE